MAKIILRQRKKDVVLSVAECILLGLAEFGSAMVESFLPKKYSFTRPGRLLLGFDRVREATVRQEFWRLQERGLVAKTSHRRDATYILTPAGRSFLHRVAMKTSRSDRWDGNWHVVIFDVPERLRKARNVLRYELSALGFKKLQSSVWVSRYAISENFYHFLKDLNLLRYTIALKVTDASQIEKIKSLCSDKKQ